MLVGNAQVFVPEVVGPIAQDILFRKSVLIASGCVVDITGEISGDDGKNVTMPYFATTEEMVQDNPGATLTGVTPTGFTMDTYSMAMLNKIASFAVDKNTMQDVSKKVDINQKAAEFIVQQSRIDIQGNLLIEAETTPLIHNIVSATTKTLNVDDILVAKMKRGEYGGDGQPILWVHSNQAKDLGMTSDFKTLASAATPVIVAAVSSAGGTIVGVVNGVVVAVLDSIRTPGLKADGTALAISGITRSTTTATATTSTAHRLRVGDTVIISGAVETEYNGTFLVATTPTSTTFTYTMSGTPSGSATGAPVFTPTYNAVMLWPGALGLYPKKEISSTVKDTVLGTTMVVVDFDWRYAVTLMRNAPRGSVVLRTR